MQEYNAPELRRMLQKLLLSYPVDAVARDRLWGSIAALGIGRPNRHMV